MLKARVITALVLLVAFAAALFGLSSEGWLLLIAILAGLAAWEWAGLMLSPATTRVLYGLLTTVLFFALNFATHTQELSLWLVYLPAIFFWLLLAPLLMARKPRFGHLFPFLGWLVLLPAFVAAVYLREVSPWLLLGVLASVWVADIAAYFTGRAFGRRKLAPTISPGKSWEGAWGAVVGVLVYGVLLFFFGLPGEKPPLFFVLLIPGLVIFTGVSIIGDLFESLLKRQAGIKDSSQLLPGHGGILDRIDSLTSTLPFAGMFLLLWT